MFEAAIITARGGSVGLPGKNLRPLGSVPLIVWTVRAAVVSGIFKRVVVSTDDEQIARVARLAGAEIPFLRPAALATSVASSTDVVRHALDALGTTGPFGLLQPTSPFRNAAHIRAAARLFEARRPPAVVSVVASKPLEWIRRVDEEGRIIRIAPLQTGASRRQDSSPMFCPNGAMYLTDDSSFRYTKTLMPDGALAFEMTAAESIDIDDGVDFQIAEALVAARVCEIDP